MVPAVVGLRGPVTVSAQSATSTGGDVTFSKDIAPILQRSCQQCHHTDGVAPMSLVTYEEVRPVGARDEDAHRACGPRAGVMPPWFVEKELGIQKFKDDPSLSDRGDRRRSRSGPTAARRAATRPTCRSPELRRQRQMDDRRTRPDPQVERRDRSGVRARTGGATSASCRPGSPRIGTCRRSKCAKSTTSRETAAPIPSADATSSIT